MESILVIPRAALFTGRWPQGFVPAGSQDATDGRPSDVATTALRAAETHGRLLPRAAAEIDPDWKQPIPYCMLVRGTEVFCVERLPRQGESRLHGRLSLGLGGHVEAVDLGSPGGPVQAALRRELAEEVRLPALDLPPPVFLGLVNDESDPVGKVHFGLVFSQQIPAQGTVEIVESPKMRGAFRHLAGTHGLWQDLDRFETWSRMLLEAGAVEAPRKSRPRCTPES